ncbi:MAG: TonB-dependent receptor [Pseudomonadota bacterium]
MTQPKLFKSTVWGVSAFAIMSVVQPLVHAQEPETPQGGEFLGTLTLGESKREVQTDTSVAITVIDKEEIDDRQATTIAELIDSVPGVSLVNGSTPSGSGINIRGFGANGTFGTDQKVAVFIDGATSGSEELYRLGTQLFTDPFLYRSVEVQRGTVGSFEYGSGIVGGIVRLETIDASDLTGGEPGFKLAQTLGFSNNRAGLNTSTTLAWQPTENVELLGNFSYREQDEQRDGAGETIGNSAFELPSWLIKGRVQFGGENAHAIEASYSRTESADRDVPYDTFITATDFFGNVDRDTTNDNFSLFYYYSPLSSDLIDLEIGLTYANQEFNQTFIDGSSPIQFLVIDLAEAEQKYETTKLTVKNNSFFELGTMAIDTRYGFELIERDRQDAYAAPGGTDNRFALFLVGDVELLPGLTFSPGLRYENSELDGSVPTIPQPPFGPPIPSPEINVNLENDALMGGASLRYEFGNGFAVFGSYAYTESLPILDDLENVVFREQPELANTSEIGISYDRVGVLSDDDALAVKLNYYDTRLDDVTSYSGADQIDTTGFEFEGSYARASGFYIDFNANIVDAEELTLTGNTIDWDRAPQDTVRVTAGQRFGGFLDLSAELLSAFDRTIDVGGATNTEADAYNLLNLRATVTVEDGPMAGTQLRVGIENAFDEEYTPLLATRPAPGQNIKLTVSKVFF